MNALQQIAQMSDCGSPEATVIRMKEIAVEALKKQSTMNKEQLNAGVWVKASERLPEFISRDKKYIVRYIKIPDELEIWIWDWINERLAAGYEIEWLDVSAHPQPAITDEAIEKMAKKVYPPIWGDESHLDGNEMSREEFIKHVRQFKSALNNKSVGFSEDEK